MKILVTKNKLVKTSVTITPTSVGICNLNKKINFKRKIA